MRALPPTTHPASEPLARRHAPIGAWPAYRPCLRWEFGFTCAFCLLHEADFVEHGAEGTGLFATEHHVARAAAPALADVYANCFYACRFCNGARGALPLESTRGQKLLHPCREAWGARFRAEGDRLAYAPSDEDAEYTHRTYRLDDRRKQVMRRHRREAIAEARRALEEAPRLIADLLAHARRVRRAERRELLAAAAELHRVVRAARTQLERYAAVPADHDRACRCAAESAQLPAFLEAQLVDTPGEPPK